MYDKMNNNVKDAIDNFAKYGGRPGGFVYAVLCNNLSESFKRADDENRFAMHDIVAYCYNELPMECWGSEDKVIAWLDKKQAEREERAGAKRA